MDIDIHCLRIEDRATQVVLAQQRNHLSALDSVEAPDIGDVAHEFRGSPIKRTAVITFANEQHSAWFQQRIIAKSVRGL